jgi:carbon-monoxide dehydrogenase medium subunit
MKMAPFAYHRPENLEEAVAVLAEHGGDAKVLAGGQSLVPMLAMRLASPAHLVDLGRVPGLDRVADQGDAVEVGALVRQAAAEQDEVVRARVPLLAAALPWIGHRAIRNRGTVGGSLAHADPAAELPAVALALGATFVLAGPGGRGEVPASAFFTGFLSTAAADDEVLVAVRFPAVATDARHGAAVVEVARRHGDFALAGAACAVHLGDDGVVVDAAVALFGVAGTPVRVPAAEAVLRGEAPSAALVAAAGAAVVTAVDPPGDGHATAAYRRHVAGVVTRRALAAALVDAGAAVEVAR